MAVIPHPEETGLYYLQSRYYNPEIGRFINADALVATGQGILGNNMFAYCNNNPVILSDHSGKEPGDLFDTPDEAALDAADYFYELGTFEKTYEYGATIYAVTTWKAVRRLVPANNNIFTRILGKLFGLSSITNRMRVVTTYVKVTKYTYTYPVTYRRKDFVLPPLKSRAVAMIHSHPYVEGYGYYQFSEPDKIYASFMGMPYYLYTATGRLLKYDPASNIVIEIGSGLPKDPHIP